MTQDLLNGLDNDEVTSKWSRLNPKVKGYWMVKGTLSFLFLSLFTLFPILFFAISESPGLALGILGLMVLILSVIFLWVVLFFDRYRYKVGSEGIYINRGIWFKSNRMIPYERIQHMAETRGPLMILFGLWDLNIFTAGTASFGSTAGSRGMFGAEGFIPGLVNPKPLRDDIWKLVKGSKGGSGLGDGQNREPSISTRMEEGIESNQIDHVRTPETSRAYQDRELLSDILMELQGLRQDLKKK